MSEETLKVVKLSEYAKLPVRMSTKAAGLDIFSAHDYVIPPFGKQLCATDIQVEIPDGCYGRVAPRSGLASKYFIDTGAGVIDGDFRGPISVLLFNFGGEQFHVKRGDRIAQLICECIRLPVVLEYDRLDETKRGDAGFGSSGCR